MLFYAKSPAFSACEVSPFSRILTKQRKSAAYVVTSESLKFVAQAACWPSGWIWFLRLRPQDSRGPGGAARRSPSLYCRGDISLLLIFSPIPLCVRPDMTSSVRGVSQAEGLAERGAWCARPAKSLLQFLKGLSGGSRASGPGVGAGSRWLVPCCALPCPPAWPEAR